MPVITCKNEEKSISSVLTQSLCSNQMGELLQVATLTENQMEKHVNLIFNYALNSMQLNKRLKKKKHVCYILSLIPAWTSHVPVKFYLLTNTGAMLEI